MANKQVKSMKIGLKDDPTSFKEVSLGQRTFIQGKSKQAIPNMADPCIRPGKVISRLKHNVTLSYMGEGMIIAPHARRMVNDIEKLGAIPSGITVVPVPMKK